MQSSNVDRALSLRAPCLALAVCLGLATAPVFADDASPVATATFPENYVDGKPSAGAVSDLVLKSRVMHAMLTDPNLYAEHIGVSVENGVVTLDGVVSSESDVRAAKRVIYAVNGVRDVDVRLEITRGGSPDVGGR